MIGSKTPLPLIKLALGYDEVNVAVMNLGVCYAGKGESQWPRKPMATESRHYRIYEGAVTSVLKELTKWKARKLGRVAIFRGTFPQHFDNVAGYFPARRGGGGLCVPSVPQLDVSPFDAAALSVYRELGIPDGSEPCSDKLTQPVVYFVPLFVPLVPRWDIQMGSFLPDDRDNRVDCTHYCYTPRLWGTYKMPVFSYLSVP